MDRGRTAAHSGKENAQVKKLLKVLLGIVVIVALGIAAVFYFTSGMVKVADDFFDAVKSHDISKAYAYLSDDFKASTSREGLSDFLSKSGLTAFKTASWQDRSISGSRGELTGSINTESGSVVPIKLSFVKGESGWRIYSIEKPQAGILDQKAGQFPPEGDQVKLVTETMHVFALSVNEKSMAKLHAHASNLMQKEYTLQKLDEVFTPFYKIGTDFTLLDNISPIFDEKPSLSGEGVLLIKGHYATKPNQVFFEQQYVYEGTGWTVLGLSVEMH
jgi:hypothetical protein